MATTLSGRTHSPALRPCVAALCVAFSAMAHAQDGNPSQLREVVVSASGFEQELREAPASISVVTREELQTKRFRDLAEALQDVEGIDVRGGTGKTGGLDISIRGMPSEYTLILIDGRRQNVPGDITPNGFGAALTSFMPPISAIERIEVIRGPMSTLYGSDAMGGVINIITRKVAKEWAGNIGVEASLPQDSEDGNTRKVNLYATGPIVQDTLGLAVRGSLMRRGEADRVLAGTGRDPAPGESRQHNIGARLTLTPNRDHDIWLDAEHNYTWYDNEDCRLGGRDFYNCTTGAATNSTAGYRDYMRFERDQIALGHTARLGFGMLESSLMRTETETSGRTIPSASRPAGSPDIGGDRELKSVSTVLDSKLVAPLGESHLLTVGGQWWNAEMTDGLLSEDHEQTMWSLFVEDEWSLTDSLKATLGGRYDRHDAFGGEFSPRAYLVWTASPQWTVKGGMSKGFRAPRLNQLIDGVSGISGQGTSINIGNPTLQPETSTNTELGLLFDNLKGVSASATLFHNKVEDRISGGGDCTVNWISSCAANPEATYSINVNEGKTWGAELSTRIALAPRWSLSMNYTWTDSELTTAAGKSGKLSDTAEHIANAQIRWDATEKLSMWVRGEYRGDSQRFDGETSALTGNNKLEYDAMGDLQGYSLFHLGAAYKVNKDLTINANVFNLFDKDFNKCTSYTNTAGNEAVTCAYFKTTSGTKGTVSSGRTLWLSANYNF